MKEIKNTRLIFIFIFNFFFKNRKIDNFLNTEEFDNCDFNFCTGTIFLARLCYVRPKKIKIAEKRGLFIFWVSKKYAFNYFLR